MRQGTEALRNRLGDAPRPPRTWGRVAGLDRGTTGQMRAGVGP